jgi:hypothetical protein
MSNLRISTVLTRRAARTDVIDTIASCMDAKVSRGQIVMDTKCYAEISHALGKLQAHGTIDIDDEYSSDDESSPPPPSPATATAVTPQQRIVNYLSHATLAKEFLDNANAHDTSHCVGVWRDCTVLISCAICSRKISAPFVSSLFQHDQYSKPQAAATIVGCLWGSISTRAGLVARRVGITHVLARRPG